EVAFGFDMKVTRVRETPRVTKPYSEEQWAKIVAAGHAVDRELKAGDVRLTMGGEPTFVSVDDMDGAERNTAALGPTKRRGAGILMRGLGGGFAWGALLHYGQGKGYPGERLPRWALSCWWRRDGEPIWRNRALLASDEDRGDARAGHADEFAGALAERLQVDPGFRVPGYEDVWYYLWRERRLPTNVDPLKSHLAHPQEPARLPPG